MQYTQDATRGPSAGGSGQDNVYQFDGVNVTLPLFGTLSAEPASHDIAQVTTIKGGARAVDFDRSGGFSIDSVSKSGTNRFAGQVSYQFQTDGDGGGPRRAARSRATSRTAAGSPATSAARSSRTASSSTASYYRPEQHARQPREPLRRAAGVREHAQRRLRQGDAARRRSSVLLNVSYRDSQRLETSDLFAANSAATTGSGNEAWQKIGTAEGSWVINARSFADVQVHALREPDARAGRTTSRTSTFNDAIGTRLDVANLDTQGRLTVPAPIAGQTAYNAFIQPLIDRYGYVAQTACGPAAASSAIATQFDDDDFFRDAGQIGYNLTLGSDDQRTTCTPAISGTPTRRI